MTETSPQKQSKLLKVVLVGDSGVGKTNILSRYINNKFLLAQAVTIGVEFSIKELKMGEQIIKMQIWDTAGQDRYRSVSAIFYKNAVGAMVVFDLSSRKSFQGTKKWISQIREQAIQGIILVLIGNKSDLPERQITTQQALALAQSQKMAYFQTSAAQNKNIEQSFEKLSEQIYKKYKQDKIQNPQPQTQIKPIQLKLKGNNKRKKESQSCCK